MSRRKFNGLGGLSGHASSMITSLKNNLRRKNLEHFKSSEKNIAYTKIEFENKATPEQLKEIRERLQKENTKIQKKYISILGVSFVLVLILFILFNYIKF